MRSKRGFVVRGQSVCALAIVFCSLSAFGQSQTIGPNGEGSFIAGAKGVPIRVLNEGNSWSQPLVVFKNSQIEIIIPDIRTASWGQSYASAFKKEGTYATYLYIYGIQSHRTMRETLYVNTRTKIAVIIKNAFTPPTRIDMCKPDPQMPIDRITAIVKDVSDRFHGKSLDDAIAEQSYAVARMAQCSGSSYSEDCALSEADYRAKHPRYPRDETPSETLLAQIGPITARLPSDSCEGFANAQITDPSLAAKRGTSQNLQQNVTPTPLQDQSSTYSQAQALSHYKASCDAGDPAGCKSYARLLDDLLNGTIRIEGLQDYQQATRYNKKACELGEVSACSEAGFLLSHASTLAPGASPNNQEAVSYYNMACEGGEMSVCFRLGMLFEYGQSNLLAEGQMIAKDTNQARIYWKNACEKKYEDACTILQTMHKLGRF